MLLSDLVTRQAEQQPDSIAVVHGREAITYRELDQASARIGWLLREKGCVPGDRVCLLLPKSIPAIASMLGSLRAGCIYVPLDIASPAARVEKIVRSCEPKYLLASAESAAALDAILQTVDVPGLGWLSPGQAPPGHDFGFSWDDLPLEPQSLPQATAGPNTAAHILFTSGSTGVPKGVVITHANILHFVEWAATYFEMQPTDRISCHPPLHFDLSMLDIYGTFLAGGHLHLVSPEISLLPHKVAEFIRSSELTQWFSVPSVLKYMAQFDAIRQDDFPALRRLLWCGEALPTPTLMYLMRRLPHVSFTNLYGPTETTIASSYYTVRECPDNEKAEIPIGRPCAGENLLVLDSDLQPTTPGETGDLYITGVGLSPGYWRDPEKTRAAFIEAADGTRMYKTGDLARTTAGGVVYLLGRADSQIKSRGYRIELGEIESALCALGMLRECAVVAVPSGGFDGTTICCAYVPHADRDFAPSDIRSRLADLLPSYMLPSQWMSCDSLPLNGNGKVDRPLLKQQFSAASQAQVMGGMVCNSQRH